MPKKVNPSVMQPLSQVGIFKIPTRKISSPSEMCGFIMQYKEPISLSVGLMGYGFNWYRSQKSISDKRLILIVRQAGASDMPTNFDSIMKGADINSVDTDGNSAFHYACANGNKEIARALLSMGANPDLKNSHGETAFYQAAFSGHLPVLDIFWDVATQYTTGIIFRQKVSISYIVDQPTNSGWTPLSAAIFNNHPKIIIKLLTHGAEIDVENHKGQNPLLLAVKSGNISLVRYILKNANISHETVQRLMAREDKYKNGNALYIAAEEGNEEMVKLLLMSGAKNTPSGKYGQTPLHVALFKGHEKVACLLAEDSNAFSYLTPDGWSIVDYVIYAAGRRGSLLDYEKTVLEHYFSINGISVENSVKFLGTSFYQQFSLFNLPKNELENLVVNYCKTDPHLLAIANRAQEIAAIKNPQKLNKLNRYGYTALHDAILFGALRAVEALVQGGADIHSLRQDGSEPLLTAAFFNQTEIALFLMEQQEININTVNHRGESALYHAIINNDLKLAEALCKKGINVRYVDEQGYHYMHTIAKYGTEEMARLLLFYGTLRDPRTVNFGNLPVHVAVIAKNIGVLKVLLLEWDADPDARNINNLTPQQLAQNDPEIIALLEAARQKKTSSNLSDKSNDFDSEDLSAMRCRS